jgi:hypothetical protein
MTRALLASAALALAALNAPGARAETYFNPAWNDPAWTDPMRPCDQFCARDLIAQHECERDPVCHAKMEAGRLAIARAACDRNPTTAGVLLCRWGVK